MFGLRNLQKHLFVTDVVGSGQGHISCAFFDLVEQVGFSFLKFADMIAFRHLLSSKVKFVWTEELAKAFVLAKVIISRKIHEGVRMFKETII